MASSTRRRAGYAAFVVALLGELACAAPVTRAPAKPTAPLGRVTVLVRLEGLSPEVRARLLKPRYGTACIVTAIESVVITDTRSNVERLLGRPISIPR